MNNRQPPTTQPQGLVIHVDNSDADTATHPPTRPPPPEPVRLPTGALPPQSSSTKPTDHPDQPPNCPTAQPQGVVIHMDDSDAGVQEAACLVLEALAAAKPGVVAAEVGKVRECFRARHYCDRVLEAAVRAGGQ